MSTNGSLAFHGASDGLRESQLVWTDSNGTQLPELGPAGNTWNLVLSPDDKFAAL